jgi:hypothetical protein
VSGRVLVGPAVLVGKAGVGVTVCGVAPGVTAVLVGEAAVGVTAVALHPISRGAVTISARKRVRTG